MTAYEIQAPKTLHADITLPASKSISNRALIIHTLAGGQVLPSNLSDCDDTRVVLQALKNRPSVIDIGAAGTAMRFLAAYLAATSGEHTLTGSERMKQRPIGILVETLRTLGADITYLSNEGFPPLLIKGRKLHGGSIEIPGNISSQFISALLMMGPIMSEGLELRLTGDIVSRPYIDLTLCTMKQFGASADWADSRTIRIDATPYEARPYLIENDWTAASYWYEIVALCGVGSASVSLRGLMDGSRQGDAVVKYIFSLLGVKTTFDSTAAGEPTTVRLTRHEGSVERLDYDFINCPDLAQTVAVTCCAMNIPFHFTGLASLKIKETDRLLALQQELKKFGYVLQVKNNSELIWSGETCNESPLAVDTYDDHRMAMAFAPLSIKTGQVKINHPEVVTKSYPRFWDDLATAGFDIACIGNSSPE